MPSFRGSLYYWAPRAFPVFPWYSWPFGFEVVTLTLDHQELRISGPWPFLSRGWHGPYPDVERADKTLMGIRFWFRSESPMTFATTNREEVLRWLRSYGVQIGPKRPREMTS